MNYSIPPYSIIAKPIGPLCNLNCRYCFYLEKRHLFGKDASFKMTLNVLESFIRQYIESQDVPEVVFLWQGGEPTLLGVDFFQKVINLQKKYAKGKKRVNAIQTNGVLIDDHWCEFFSEHDFLVGVSLDGPEELHNCYRIDKKGRPTFKAVMRGLGFLKKHAIRFNTMTVLNDYNSRHPLAVYRFLKEVGDGFMQFIPIVECKPDKRERELGFQLGFPPVPGKENRNPALTSWSVKPKQFADFYIQIFDEWVRKDVGKVFVQFFDTALNNWMGVGSGLCVFAPTCGNAGALEYNGDLYSCDHYVYPQYKLGNILNKPLSELIKSDRQLKFGQDKADSLTGYCLDCDVRFACNGDCPKHRFLYAPDGEPGLSYLCPAYRRIFKHMDPHMQAMSRSVRSGHEAAQVMNAVAEGDRRKQFASANRNDPCPCGSGRKYKRCCGS